MKGPTRRPVPQDPPATVDNPPAPPMRVRTLAEAVLTATSPWACANTMCRAPRIEPGQRIVRTVEGDYLHSNCGTTGWPPALVAPTPKRATTTTQRARAS